MPTFNIDHPECDGYTFHQDWFIAWGRKTNASPLLVAALVGRKGLQFTVIVGSPIYQQHQKLWAFVFEDLRPAWEYKLIVLDLADPGNPQTREQLKYVPVTAFVYITYPSGHTVPTDFIAYGNTDDTGLLVTLSQNGNNRTEPGQKTGKVGWSSFFVNVQTLGAHTLSVVGNASSDGPVAVTVQ